MYPYTAESTEKQSLLVLLKETILFTKGPLLTTSSKPNYLKRPQLLTTSHCGIGFQHRNYGETHSVRNSKCNSLNGWVPKRQACIQTLRSLFVTVFGKTVFAGKIKLMLSGQAQWLTPIVPSL